MKRLDPDGGGNTKHCGEGKCCYSYNPEKQEDGIAMWVKWDGSCRR